VEWRDCPVCGSKLNLLRGATGRIGICPRCGWYRIEPATGPKSADSAERVGRSEVWQQQGAS
jgi:ribosomal protein L37AE/L43A